MSLEPLRSVVTGGGGFLGRAVVEELRARGARPFVPGSAEADLVQMEGGRRLVRRMGDHDLADLREHGDERFRQR